MQAISAQGIIRECKLIPSKVSQKILNAIVFNQNVDNLLTKYQLSKSWFQKLKENYQQKLKQINVAHGPRNLPFYLMVKEQIPTFDWEMVTDGARQHVKFKKPLVNRLRPSLVSLLLNHISTMKQTKLHRRYGAIVDVLPNLVVHRLETLFHHLQINYPDPAFMHEFVNWLKKGLNGERLHIVMPACPDYSVEETGDRLLPYRYTFNSVGADVGLVGKRFLNILPELHLFFESLNIKVHYTVAYGDFEAFSEANLTRLKLTEEAFLNKVQESIQRFQKVSPISVRVTTFTSLCGGHLIWPHLYQQAKHDLEKQEYGQTGLTESSLLNILKARKPLYERWFGSQTDSSYLDTLIKQGAEYSAMGWTIARYVKNGMVLGADNAAMMPFYWLKHRMPVLYLKRIYE